MSQQAKQLPVTRYPRFRAAVVALAASDEERAIRLGVHRHTARAWRNGATPDPDRLTRHPDLFGEYIADLMDLLDVQH
jgi:hypothetical protein